ncbi:MAG TPA: YciI family protein [Puia sp.]|nr:YciI family protein [Puia sp.]
MSKSFILWLGLIIANIASAQNSGENKSGTTEMKQYFFVMLTTGPNRSQDSVTATRIQEGHMKNIRHLADLGKLVIAGPFGDDSAWKGFFIFDCKSTEEIDGYLKSDPAITSGRLLYQVHPWWTAKNCLFK